MLDIRLVARSPTRRRPGGRPCPLRGRGTGAGATPTKRVAKLEQSGDGSSVLANLKGRTLYSLSVEKHGKFICTGAAFDLAPARWCQGGQPRARAAWNGGATGRQDPGDLQGPSALQLRRRHEQGDRRRGDQGRRHLARGQGAFASAPQPTEPPQPYPTDPYPTTPPKTESPPQPPTEPPHEYPPYGY